jgi:hypothetical protein
MAISAPIGTLRQRAMTRLGAAQCRTKGSRFHNVRVWWKTDLPLIGLAGHFR